MQFQLDSENTKRRLRITACELRRPSSAIPLNVGPLMLTTRARFAEECTPSDEIEVDNRRGRKIERQLHHRYPIMATLSCHDSNIFGLQSQSVVCYESDAPLAQKPPRSLVLQGNLCVRIESLIFANTAVCCGLAFRAHKPVAYNSITLDCRSPTASIWRPRQDSDAVKNHGTREVSASLALPHCSL